MDKEKLVAFLRGYASLVRSKYDFLHDLPLKANVVMPTGCCVIETANEAHLATIQGGSLGPSMPVGPRDIAYTRLFAQSVDLLIAAKALVEKPIDEERRQVVAAIIHEIEGES